jgi:beta-lactamase superfamily II metal-dependent hydrolase
LPPLADDRLSVLVFGPGIGELILVRVPPGSWMVLDGCGVGETDYAVAVLEHYQAKPNIIVLTHPHKDHSRGVSAVIEAATPPDRKETWPRIGMVLPPGDNISARSDGFFAGETGHAIAAIEQRWNDAPACRWDVNAGDVERLGDATLRVLSPREEVRAEQMQRWPRIEHNVLSTALLLEWRGRRVVLGSDLVETPRHGWTHGLVIEPDLGDHDLLKVPHHGSDRALHDDVVRPGTRVPAPHRVITPYSIQRLPRFKPGVGGHRVASLPGSTYLSGLPRRHEEQSGREEERTLAELGAHDGIQFDPKTGGFPDCYVLVSFPPDGEAPIVERGPGSLRIVP